MKRNGVGDGPYADAHDQVNEGAPRARKTVIRDPSDDSHHERGQRNTETERAMSTTVAPISLPEMLKRTGIANTVQQE